MIIAGYTIMAAGSKRSRQQRDGIKYPLGPLPPSHLNAWVVESLRSAIEPAKVRNSLIRQALGDLTRELDSDFELGPTFSNYYDMADLERYVYDALTKESRHTYEVFTAANIPLKGETHFQTFIADRSTLELIIIDPAYAPWGAIYGAVDSEAAIREQAARAGWRVVRVDTPYACQITDSDVFCQTWSLIMMLDFMRQKLTVPKGRARGRRKLKEFLIPDLSKSGPHRIYRTTDDEDAPRELMEPRYRLLLNFYKGSITNEVFCRELQKAYMDKVKGSGPYDLVPYLKSKKGGKFSAALARTAQRQALALNPCEAVYYLTVDDMF